ncbi:HepT-like ribonuclease domain-containing protein [Nocardioides alcanivorans]|uniref:HepT-like ribonuclease domain-containing protein n=1 Tax=Nocardioides alcanivorans TaxID=2897352 RepID=UPI001F2EEEBF|nr:HepT-like ribonuclease domain-containing protein [Nocardioides alcanivorans]
MHKLIGMRNVLIHGYAQVNNLTVWRTATQHLDDVLSVVEALLAATEQPDPPA